MRKSPSRTRLCQCPPGCPEAEPLGPLAPSLATFWKTLRFSIPAIQSQIEIQELKRIQNTYKILQATHFSMGQIFANLNGLGVITGTRVIIKKTYVIFLVVS